VPNWHGNGTETIAPFTASEPWTLHWTTQDSGGLTIFVYATSDASGQYSDVASSNAPGDGQSYETTTGDIYLKVVGAGPWKIWAVPAD
jgi:hypothetical protein